MPESIQYVIITPAYNEARYIGETIECVIKQTCLPLIWLIVDDGSDDQTGFIIKEYAQRYPWIRYHARTRVAGQSYYSSNVYAIMEGFDILRKESFDCLAILDADISLPRRYYETLLGEFEADPHLGISSGVYVDNVKGKMRNILNDRRSTPKALMVFRRQCYEEIGGFVPMKYGGEDTCACFAARMRGWKAWSFPDLIAVHNKPVGTGHGSNILTIRFRHGLCEWGLAAHPLFLILKSLRRCLREYPPVLSGIARILGFLYGYMLFEKRQIPDQLVRFIRREHWQRLTKYNQIPEEMKIDKKEKTS